MVNFNRNDMSLISELLWPGAPNSPLKVMEYMQKNLENKLDAAMIAAKFGFSDRSLSRLFYAEGISFIEYMQSLRVVKSMELLAENNMNINMVAASVGYESITAFSNVFLRFTGLRPSEYIKRRL
jgi:transcriptional regulator GlxA family with amidase domain